ADVIKVEPPGRGDFTRAAGNWKAGYSATFLNNNRNKRSITIDLKTSAGVDVLKRLAKTCDALVQNFRPGVVERMGVGFEDIRAVAPKIVYVSLSGFGEVGPYAHKPVYDPIVQALSGLASVQGGADDQRPRLVRTILPDKLTAITASQAITAALLSRERTGEGQHVRLSMLDSIVAFLWSSDMGGQTFVGETVAPQRAASFIDLIYETEDGHMSVAVMTDAQWAGLTRALEHPDWLTDPRFATPELRDLNINDRLALIQAELTGRKTAEWVRRFDAEGVPCAPVLTRNEMIHHPQIEAAGIIQENTHPEAGPLRQARDAARFEGTPAEYRRGAPGLGENGEEILREAGLPAAEIEELLAAGIVGG
ncbi:MAG: CoA transferase, partial [Rhodospirillales bacterium]|nr:CoA transferase [Rhodospirillales bacterium]